MLLLPRPVTNTGTAQYQGPQGSTGQCSRGQVVSGSNWGEGNARGATNPVLVLQPLPSFFTTDLVLEVLTGSGVPMPNVCCCCIISGSQARRVCHSGQTDEIYKSRSVGDHGEEWAKAK